MLPVDIYAFLESLTTFADTACSSFLVIFLIAFVMFSFSWSTVDCENYMHKLFVLKSPKDNNNDELYQPITYTAYQEIRLLLSGPPCITKEHLYLLISIKNKEALLLSLLVLTPTFVSYC